MHYWGRHEQQWKRLYLHSVERDDTTHLRLSGSANLFFFFFLLFYLQLVKTYIFHLSRTGSLYGFHPCRWRDQTRSETAMRGFRCDSAAICHLSLHHQWCSGGWVWNIGQWRCARSKPRLHSTEALTCRCPVFTASSTRPPLNCHFYSNNPPQDWRLKQCLLTEVLEIRRV